MSHPSEAAPRGRYRDALRQRDYRLLTIAFLVDTLGNWSYSVVLAVYVFAQTHSPGWLAALTVARWGTSLLLGAPASVMADRFDRARLMLGSALCSAAVMTLIAVDVAMRAPVWTLLILSATASAIYSPYLPAAGALTPEVVEEKDLAAANALFATLDNLTVIVGPLIGAALLTISATAGIIANAASFVIAAFVVSRLLVRSRGTAEKGGGVFGQWTTGLRTLLGQRVAFFLVLFCALDSAIYGASSVVYVPLAAHLGMGLRGYSILLAGNALGCILAAAVANRLSASSRLTGIIFISIVVQAVPFALTAATTSAPVAVGLQLISGVGMIIVDVLALAALQRDIERGVLSRVLGAYDMLIVLAAMAGSLGSAALLSTAGLRWTLVVIGVLFPIIAALGLPAMRRGERAAAAKVQPVGELADMLARLDMFTDAPRSVLERLAMAAEQRSVPAGTVLIREGDPADALWVLVDGSLAVDQAATGELPPVNAPGYVGEIGLMHRRPRTATVRASTDCTMFRIDGAEFIAAYESTPPSTSLVQLAGVRLMRTNPGLPDPATSGPAAP